MTEEELVRHKEKMKQRSGKGNVDAEFWTRISRLVKYVVPNYTGKEAQYIGLLAGLLVIRTMMSIWLADVNGRVVKAIVNKDLNLFIKRVSNIVLCSSKINLLPLDFCSIPFCPP
jgi:ABC-type uncharacterized transport system fused permease/ATPase subunit